MSSITKPASPVSLDVPDTTVTLQGYAAPGALVTFVENGSVIGTVLADSFGAYSTTLGSQAVGIRSIGAFFTDSAAVQSQITTQSVSVQSQQDTVVDNFLSPTIIRRTAEQAQQGSVVQINGYSAANATVTITLEPAGIEQTVIADVNGFYEILLDTTNLNANVYTASVQARLGVSQSSERSKNVSFEIVSETGPTGPDIVVSPEQLPPPIPQSPDDGSVIDGDSVTISGESVPNAQIKIFENGEEIGSIFADEFGRWSFVYQASSTPVTLSFEACIDGLCSVLSKSITLSFTSIGVCKPEFLLEQYRFWGVSTGEMVDLQVRSVSGRGVVEIDWDDGTVESFSHDEYQNLQYIKSYRKTGSYNGTITFYENDNKDDAKCKVTRYFSVHVTSESSDIPFWRIFWLFFVATVLFLLSQYYSTRAEK